VRCTHREWILVVFLAQLGSITAGAGDTRQADALARAWSTIPASALDTMISAAARAGQDMTPSPPQAEAAATTRQDKPGITAPPAKPDPTAFSIYVLSRGKGVPPDARNALNTVSEIVEGDRRRGVRVETARTRIGLEGETRLCVDYERADDARRAITRIEKAIKDVALINLVPGACPPGETPREKDGTRKKEKP
jgi:hypothetical protein